MSLTVPCRVSTLNPASRGSGVIMRRALVVSLLFAGAFTLSVVAMLLPIRTHSGANCGSVFVAAGPPANDDSWFSTCAQLREQRRDIYEIPGLLCGIGLVVAGSVTAMSYRNRTLGFVDVVTSDEPHRSSVGAT
jgi:hypothetical protein